ncbi:MAG: hypothetical protein HYX72_03190 [Acidobacteria bacterium]|nr:hypothetical protein [Acidobacteriota bacterium]
MERFYLYAAVLGVLAFILAIPMAVAANLLTPKVQRWWASSSRSRALKRLSRLEKQISELQAMSEWHLMARIMHAGVGFFFALFMILLALLYFLYLNDLYLFAHNGFKLQSDITETDIVRKAERLIYIISTSSFIQGLEFHRLSVGLRQLSPTHRNKRLEDLKTDRDVLTQRLGVVDNSLPRLTAPHC